MENTKNAALADDLAYVRALAEEGAHAPLISGRYYVVWGGLMAAASFFVYLNAIEIVQLGQAGFMAPWFVALALGWAASYAMRSKMQTKPGAATVGNQTAFSVWFAVGVFMTTLFVALLFAHDKYTDIGVPAYFLFSLLFPIGFGVYGVAFMATATAARAGWLRYFSILSWGFAAASLFYLATATQFLVGAIGLALCAAAPGVLLMRREPSETI